VTATDASVEAVRVLARVSRLLERACGDLSLAHYRVLAAVADGDERASRVARRLALGKPAISASVDTLCRRGLLTRESAADQRAITLRLTAEGRTVLAEAEAAMTARLATVLARTSRPGEVTAVLGRLGAGLDRLAEDRAAAR
jgi:DNA-binding MarR family transcriptional regulator